MGDIFLRQTTCNQCLHGMAKGVNYNRTYCRKTKREGNATRACYCEKFESRLKRSGEEVSAQGFKYRSKQVEDYRTKRQWEDVGYRVKEGVKGHEMHPSMLSSKTYIYFLPEEVEKSNP